MSLTLSTKNISALFSNKAARLTSYVALAVFSVIAFAAMNESMAITEAQLAQDAVQGADQAGTVFNTPVLWTINFLQGTGGLFATVVAFIMTLYAAIIAKSLMGIIVAVGIGIAAVFGPDILMSIFGAII